MTGSDNDDFAPDDPRRPLDPRDYSRRTLLANERTYLAWWRTGLTTLAVAIAAARVVPELSNTQTKWPYTLLGAAFAALGTGCIIYGERRRAAVSNAIRQGSFAEPSRTATLIVTGAGAALGIAVLAVILTAP